MMKKENTSSLLAIVMAFLATSCCIGPAIFLIFGTSIGFLGEFSFLSPLRPYFLGFAYIVLGLVFWKLFIKKPDCKCEADRKKRRIARAIFAIGAVMVLAATFFNKIMLAIYG
jgi:mercuric ion transport protein